MSPWIQDQDSSNWLPRRNERDSALLSEVRRRDGDQCRFCRRVVDFSERTSAVSGTYVHAMPTASGGAYLVVACRGCDVAKRDGAVMNLLLPPSRPVYSEATLQWLPKDGDREFIVDHDAEFGSVGKREADERLVDNGFLAPLRVDRVRARRRGFPARIRHASKTIVALRDPRNRQLINRSLDPGGFNKAVHHDRLLDVVLDGVPIAQFRINVELVPLVQNSNRHQMSPSVGAPFGAGVGTSQPTEGEPPAGASKPPAGAPASPESQP